MENDAEKSAWEIYNERAEIVDGELVRDWNESLNSLLIFVRRRSMSQELILKRTPGCSVLWHSCGIYQWEHDPT